MKSTFVTVHSILFKDTNLMHSAHPRPIAQTVLRVNVNTRILVFEISYSMT